MGRYRWRAALAVAMLLFHQPAYAQDVTLTALNGGLTLTGQLQGYDGEFYRIETSYGLLTVDGQGVLCDGPGCPDLTNPKAAIRFVGTPDAGQTLLPPLVEAFAASRGLGFSMKTDVGFVAEITDPATGKVMAEFSFIARTPQASRAALAAGRAELIVAAAIEPDFGHRALALDALLPIMATDNPTPRISTADLARALTGEATNWRDVGGPDMPIVLHGLAAETDLQRALAARLDQPVAPSVLHPDMESLAAAVARDPWALAVTGRAMQGRARALPLTDSCGFPLLPSALAVKAEDYPLSLPIFLLTPRRRLPLFAREFLDFLATPAAQASIREAGFIDRSPQRQAMTADGLRLINAIQGAGEEVTLPDLKRLVDGMAGADRLSLTFRFEDGSSTLDAHSRENLTDLARLLQTGAFKGEALVFAGFSDGSGAAQANLDLSRARAESVAAALRAEAPDLPDDLIPTVDAFGETMPMACDATTPGRQLNRRVELWIKPTVATDTPAP
jgi:phosphate transport system substrate-binding protein